MDTTDYPLLCLKKTPVFFSDDMVAGRQDTDGVEIHQGRLHDVCMQCLLNCPIVLTWHYSILLNSLQTPDDVRHFFKTWPLH